MGELKRYDVSGKDSGGGRPYPDGTTLKLDEGTAARMGLIDAPSTPTPDDSGDSGDSSGDTGDTGDDADDDVSPTLVRSKPRLARNRKRGAPTSPETG